ncbi:flagellar biosynthesis anti-sigma factor FlgM [Pantoea sp. BIGb0393]|uniref:Negative regulator of flagellin synthesis n=1 Tax=Pantoea nemavictus TaxID=2726955 RepID=A0ABU8PQR1_9GAMM|nr:MULTISPECIES: flagellar biosynthesis anti-sigma factor FlgM [Pantoea]EJL87150.1 flagellar biosynthesis anti-sigma factor FlgM [Pantoea sp. GM01]MBA0035854.1 flagellar biosynthesis anti-sigma factor FlgM [Pantoea nemavictus]
MKITRNETGVAPVAKPVTAALNDAPAAAKSDRAAARSDNAAQGPMQTAQQQLREMPEVDATFVSAMQDALKAGRLQVDTDALAQAMMDFYRS